MRISDWSSDVCSSDLLIIVSYPAPSGRARIRRQSIVPFAVFASRRIAPECGEFCQDVVRRMSWVRHRKGEPDEGIRYHRLRRDWLYRPARLRTFGSKLRSRTPLGDVGARYGNAAEHSGPLDRK